MQTIKINGINYNILDDTVDDFDVIARYQGEFDIDVVTK